MSFLSTEFVAATQHLHPIGAAAAQGIIHAAAHHWCKSVNPSDLQLFG